MMKKALSSPLVAASNNIVSFSGDSSRRLKGIQREVIDFSKFLNTQNKEINRIKLPEKRKIRELANLNIASSFGSPGNLLSSLLGGALDVAGFLGNMFPPRGRMGAPQNTRGLRPPKPMVSGSKLQFGGLKSVGILNAVFSGLDFAQGLAEGESTGQAASGAVGNLAGSLLGGAIGQALIPIPGLGFVIGSMAGGFLGGYAADRTYELATGGAGGVSGKVEERLKAQEQQQKASVQEGGFGDIINRFSESVGKFENFVYKSFASMVNAAAASAGSDEMMLDYGLDPDSVPDAPEITGELPDMTAEGGQMPSKYTSSPYGWRWGRIHSGVDYAITEGTPVSVIQPGQVTYAQFNDGGYGYAVQIAHPGGSSSFYGHLSKISVKQGQQIEPGTVIGNVGSTGRSTGPHVHFEIRQGSKRLEIPTSEGDKYFRFGGNVKVKPKAGVSGAGSNPFVLELHADPNAKGQKTGLIPSNTSPDTAVSQALVSSFGTYGKNFRGGLGVTNRGGNILETDMALGAEANARRIVEAMLKDPKRAYHIFAGHADVTKGETGAPGEKEYNLKTAELVEKLAKAQKLNVMYHKSIIANEASDPNSNLSRIKAIMDASKRPGIGGPDLTPEAMAAYQSGMIQNLQQYPSYNQLQQVTTIIPMMMSPQGGGGQQKPVFIPVGGGGGGTVILPGPDEGQVVNSLMKTMLLTNLSAS
jgi:murein DD-endopeptidase MepM/ murein hydrolase activator NlpD